MKPPQDEDSFSEVEFRFADSTQLTEKSDKKKFPYIYKVRKRSFLREAWNKVYQNGIISKCEKTRQVVKEFALDSERNLEKIYRDLLHDKWIFMPARGAPIRREGKTARPIVVSPIPNRIVQRSILDVLQEEPNLKPFYQSNTSFGGIKARGVKDAIQVSCESIKRGLSYYIRSDIKDFFTNIPRQEVIKTICSVIQDGYFIKLLDDATKTELSNMADLKQYKDLFPIYEVGVAQGCCLSPLLGNILLHDFDRKMNDRGIVCLRYIDDFLILGDSPSRVRSAFNSAKTILSSYGLDAYDPDKEIEKADKGKVVGKNGLEFLGCEIFLGLINPNKKSRQRILLNIKNILEESIKLMPNPNMMYRKGRSMSETFVSVSNTLKGWGNQYSFCTDKTIMADIDKKIDIMLQRYCERYREITTKLDQKIEKNL